MLLGNGGRIAFVVDSGVVDAASHVKQLQPEARGKTYNRLFRPPSPQHDLNLLRFSLISIA